MYRLSVFYPDEPSHRAAAHCERANDAMRRLADLLAQHPDCLRVEVMLDDQRLFTVDCAGNRLP